MESKEISRENYINSVGSSPFIYVGSNCNNNCIFCFEKDAEFNNKQTDELKKEIDVIRKTYDFINFMGQEPTLRKDIVDLVAYAKQLNFNQVGITTNGRMFAYAKFAKLILSDLDQVVVTVMGSDPTTHDFHTESKNSFMQTLQGIKNVVAIGRDSVSLVVNLMITEKNYKKILEIVDFYHDIGVVEMNIGHILPYNRKIREEKNIIAKMSDVVPYLIKAHEKHGQEMKFLFVEYPACVFPEKYRYLSFPCLEENYNKSRIDICAGCPFFKKCVGIPKDYLALYGDKEFAI